MSEGWRVLGDVLAQVNRSVVVADVESVPYAGVRWYAGGVYLREVADPEGVKAKQLARIREGDVIYNRMWATRASFGIARADVDGCLVTNDFPTFETNTDLALVDFIGLILQTKDFQAEAALRASGTTERRRLKEKDFLSIETWLPSLPEQCRIVDLMGALDEAIAVADESHEAASFAYIAALQDFDGPRHPRREISEVLKKAKAGGTPSRLNLDNFGGAIPWLKSGEVNNDNIHTADESLSEFGLSGSSAWIAPAGSTVVAMYGQGDTKGTAGFLRAPMSMNQAVIALVPETTLIEPRLLMHAIRSRTGSLRARAIGAAQPNLSKSIVLSEAIAVPPRDDQASIADYLDAFLLLCSDAGSYASALRCLRTNLLTALLSGEHEIPATYDDLLEVHA
ncbi:hypothetical protein A20C1_00325 [marine actinobacterium PHSC20C1]|nr:hypothetical protein A20C1_00325 [marine actinobacterium PHSC20C1]